MSSLPPALTLALRLTVSAPVSALPAAAILPSSKEGEPAAGKTAQIKHHPEKGV